MARIDGAPTLTPAIVNNQTNWHDPVLVTKQSSTTFSDKEQIWADNAESSPFFGNAYLCLASFRSNSQGNAAPQPLVVATSRDGGNTWTNKQVTSASNNPFNPKQGFGRSGCTVRTDSHGVVYVFANQFAVGMPGSGKHIMVRSFDGGKSWERPVELFTAVDTCFLVQFDGTSFRCVMDGVGGARDDLSAAPSVDIANGAPTGAGATNVIYDSWVDGRDGVNDVHVLLSYSANGGATWSAPQAVETGANDRGYYSAVALSPDGTDAYVVYNAFTTPLRNNTTDPREPRRGRAALERRRRRRAGRLHRAAPWQPRVTHEAPRRTTSRSSSSATTSTPRRPTRTAPRCGTTSGTRADCPAVDTWRAGVQTTLVPRRPARDPAGLPVDVRQQRHLRRLLRRSQLSARAMMHA